MAMQFKPKTEKEIREAQLWPKGEYDFRVQKAEPAVGGDQSKNPGMAYIRINVAVYNQDGAYRFVDGVLHPKMEAQLRHFCEVGNMIEKYETGTLEANDCVGIEGKLRLKVKDANGNYPAKNEIADFIPAKPVEKKIEPKGTGTSLKHTNPNDGDDVPF